MRKNYPGIEREKSIRSRQDPVTWGAAYTPGQLATREEAPDYSRPSIVKSGWLGRKVHCMSEPELNAFILGSWLNAFIDMHEGRMMSPEPSAGFLVGCPFSEQVYAGAHCGTIQAAERLGLLQFHPIFKSDRGLVAFPLLADFLFFGKDAEGAYAVNWCIKNHPEDFLQSFKARGPTAKQKSDEEHRARLLIEAELFKDAQIRTISLSERDIPEHLRRNLRSLYAFLYRDRTLPESIRQEFVEAIKLRIPTQVPVNETITKFIGKHGGAFHDYLVALNQALWSCEIECDLCRPLQVDLPLKPSSQNIKKLFEQWCTRGLS